MTGPLREGSRAEVSVREDKSVKQRHRFRPTILEMLENRMVLSHGVSFAPVAVNHLNLSGRRGVTLSQVSIDETNQFFDSFTRDYLQVQGAYFATDATMAPTARGTFREYVVQRVNLLAEQLTRTFALLPGSLNRLPPSSGSTTVLASFLQTRINGATSTSLRTSLIGGPRSGAIPITPISGPAATLFTYQAISAIETARTATMNSASFLIHHTFVNGKPQH